MGISRKDYIGPNPVSWMDRLSNVLSDASFTDAEKRIIGTAFNIAHEQLVEHRRGLQDS